MRYGTVGCAQAQPAFEHLEPRLLLDGLAGAEIQAHWPTGPEGVVDHIDVTFDREIDPASFTPDDVGLLDISGSEISFVGQIGDSARFIAIEGSYAYLSTEDGVVIVDVSTPSARAHVSTYDIPDGALEIVPDGDLAYVAAGESGLLILDVSDPSAPALLGSYETPGGRAGSVALAYPLVYVADSEMGVHILDVSDPADPEPVGSCATPRWTTDVKVVGATAYITCFTGTGSSMVIVDVSTPSAPSPLGAYNSDGVFVAVEVAGSLAYISDYGQGVRIVDVSVPRPPRSVGFYPTGYFTGDVDVVGSLAYIVCGGYLAIVDVSNPTNPQTFVTRDEPGEFAYLAVSGSLAYLALGTAGMEILDVSTPSSPSLVGSYAMPPAYGRGLDIYDSMAFTLGRDSLWIVDVSAPSEPTLVGSYPTDDSYGPVVVRDSLAYLDCEYSNYDGLMILDVSAPSAPVMVGHCRLGSTIYYIELAGDLAYVGGGESLWVVDVSDPANPTRIETYSAADTVTDVEVVGDLAYVGEGSEGLTVLDVSTPTDVARVARHDLGGWVAGVDVVDGIAYVILSDTGDGLRILDVADPADPVLLGSFWTRGAATDVDVVGSLAYVRGSYGLHIVDVSDPSAAHLVASTPRFPGDLQVSGGLLYAFSSGGLRILRLGQPVSGISHVAGNTYRIDLGGPLPPGEYAVQIGPDIVDTYGDPMDQDRDGFPGQMEDIYTFRVSVPIPGDANGDGVVDGGDFTLWADNYKQPGGWGEGDFNGDGFVDGGDWTLWADNYAPAAGAAEGLAPAAYDAAGDASAGVPADMLAFAALPRGRSPAGNALPLSGWAETGAGRGRVMRPVAELIGATLAAGADQEAERLPEGSGGRKASELSLHARLGRKLPGLEAELNLLEEPDLTVLPAAI